MLTSLFLAAVEAHGAVTGASEPGLIEKFGVEWQFVLFQGISFLILFGVLYKFFIKPTTATMEERQSKIEAGLKYAEDMKVQLAASQQETATLVKNAQFEANKIIEESRKTAKDFADKIGSGDPIALAEVARDTRKGGESHQSFSERQLHEQALDRLATELAAIEGIDKPTALARFIPTAAAA